MLCSSAVEGRLRLHSPQLLADGLSHTLLICLLDGALSLCLDLECSLSACMHSPQLFADGLSHAFLIRLLDGALSMRLDLECVARPLEVVQQGQQLLVHLQPHLCVFFGFSIFVWLKDALS